MFKTPRDFAIVIVAALATLTPTLANATPPDLCDERVLTVDGDLYEDSTGLTISRWCAPHTDPPIWDGPACCSITDEARCEAPTGTGRCASGTRYHCDYGEQFGDEVVCYEPGPSACELGLCGEYDGGILSATVGTIWVCCIDIITDAICHYAGTTSNGDPPEVDCAGFMGICNWGQTNLDGTVTCHG